MKKIFLIIPITIVIVASYKKEFVDFISDIERTTAKYSALTNQIHPKRLNNPRCLRINNEGLHNLHVYGSGIINYKNFMPDYKGDKSKVYVINLVPRTLYYYNKNYLSWYGNSYLDKLLGYPLYSHLKFLVYKTLKKIKNSQFKDNDDNALQTEEELVKAMGAHYYMPLTEKVNWPTDVSYVDDFISFCENLPDDAIVYFHCSHGKGRTTTFLVMYDIFKNHKRNIPLESIVTRHYCLGRQDLFDTRYRPKGTWTVEALEARKIFITQFHKYMTSLDGYGTQSWSQWHKSQNFLTKPVTIYR